MRGVMRFVPLPITRLPLVAALCAGLLLALALAAPPADAAVPQAKLINDRRAVAPPSAPPAVKKMIAAANHIRNRPYRLGRRAPQLQLARL